MASLRAPGLRRLNALLQQAETPVFLLDAGRRLVFVNRAWEELTGFAADEVAGLECRPPGPTREPSLDGFAASFCPPPEALEGRPCAATTLVVHPGGERRWRRVEYWPLRGEGAAVAGLLGLVRAGVEPAHAPESPSARATAGLLALRERLRERFGDDPPIGAGPAHARLLRQIEAASALRAPALVVGEPGTGKRHVARAIHRGGPRPDAPLLVLDAAALPADALEPAALGLTQAEGNGPPPNGLAPQGATIVIAEVEALPRDVQQRVAAWLAGGDATPLPDVRWIALTAEDPERGLRADRLRPDLYYALTGLVIHLAPLRDRLDELAMLALHFLERANARNTRRRSGFTPEALDVLRAYDWPGNLAELARVVEAAHERAGGDLVAPDDLPTAIRGHLASAYTPPPMPPAFAPLDATLEQVERRLIEQALQRFRHNKSRAAEALSISRPRLYRRMKELGIPDLPEENGTAGGP
jgi:PAS domain S-box-containing protein